MKYLSLLVFITACEYVTGCTHECPPPEPVVKEQVAPSEESCKEFVGRGGTVKVECKDEVAPAPVKKAKAKAATKPKAK